MRSLSLVLIVVYFGMAAFAQETNKSGVPVGKDLPGAFQVLMVTGKRSGSFSCPVCEHGLDLGVLVFCRDLEAENKPLTTLLQKLDALITAHPDARLAGSAILLDDGGYRDAVTSKVEDLPKVTDLKLTKAIVSKETKVARVKALADELKLAQLVLALDTSEGPSAYKLIATTDVTVLLYNKLKVVGNYAFAKGTLDNKEVDKIVKDLEKTVSEVEMLAHSKR